MQNRVFKFINLIFFGFVLISQTTVAQSVTGSINEADSLFAARRYTQSLRIYERIYNEEEQATPAMLLKMAYSTEAMDNLAKALLYLHDYYRLTSDEEVLKKMEALASVNGLEGFDMSQFDQAKKAVEDYKLQILGVLLAFALLILAMMFRKIQKHKAKSPSLAVSLVIVLALVFYVVNLNSNKTKALIMENNAYLMSGPSAAAELIEVVRQGHKVEVIGKKDIWYEIKWKGRRAYIRENNLKELL